MSDRTLQSRWTNPTTEREREIARFSPWFHNLHLPDGSQTAPNHPLGDFPSDMWQAIEPNIPKDLTGWKALDIGCNAGFYTFELAKRGAEVTAVDMNPHYLAQLKWAAGEFGLQDRIDCRQMQVYELAHTTDMYDIVWFMGVLYHLRYPLLGLDIVSRKVRRMMIFQSLTSGGKQVEKDTRNLTFDDIERMDNPGWPQMAFIEHRLEDDPTNWWLPNHACMEAMLRSCGMRVTVRPGKQIYIAEPLPNSEEARANTAELRAATGRTLQQE